MQTKSKTPLIVGGALTALVALAVLAGATGLLWVHAAKNDHGYLTTSAHRFHTGSRALVSTTVTLDTDLPHWLLDKVRVEATGDKPLFLGLAALGALLAALAAWLITKGSRGRAL